MPRYDYRCRACGANFEKNRPMSESGEPAECPQGHTDSVKLLTTVGLTGAAAVTAPSSGGGCCGGGCCGGG